MCKEIKNKRKSYMELIHSWLSNSRCLNHAS